jgi:two-component system OmpR family sensor kinase
MMGALMTIGDEAGLQTRQAVQQFLEDALVALNHELRTPLAAMKGYATTLIRHDRRISREERLEMLRSIDRACDHITAVIELAAQAARLTGETVTLDRHPVDLVTLVREAVAAVEAQPLADDAPLRAIVVTVDAGSPVVLGDAPHLRQVFRHLLDNALRFSPPGTPITIAIAGEPPQTPEDRPTVVVRVRDEGIGIAPDIAERIFEPFFRAESGLMQSYGGLGLGLTYCQRVIAQLGGAIWSEPAPDGGAIVAFRLDAAP